MERETTDHSRRNPTTSAVAGRSTEFSCQQLSVMVHTESTSPSSCASHGRAGRSPSMILNITDGEFRPVNGCLPVNTYG